MNVMVGFILIVVGVFIFWVINEHLGIIPAAPVATNTDTLNLEEAQKESNGKLIAGAVMSVIGLIGTIYMQSVISNDWTHYYSPPFSQHEITNIRNLAGSVLLLAIGVVLCVAHFTKNKKE